MKKALVIFSGGQDSTTCLIQAKQIHDSVECINFLYGQKHAVEIECARSICKILDVPLKEVDLSFFKEMVESALTSDGDVNETNEAYNLPSSFVPNRNALFITIAHAYAQKIGADVLVTGVCETDYSGYPDCRSEFINSIEKTLGLSSKEIEIYTPLMHLDKAQTFKLAEEIGALNFIIEHTHTCYNGDHETAHDWGYGCGKCPACVVRARGWENYIHLT